MGYTEFIWEEIGNETLEFTNLDGSKELVTVNEMREYILELSKKKEDLHFSDPLVDYKFHFFKGRINAFLNENIEEYFPPYKNCAFRISYSVLKGQENFSLDCIYENYIWGISSDHLESVYSEFKKKIDDGSIYW